MKNKRKDIWVEDVSSVNAALFDFKDFLPSKRTAEWLQESVTVTVVTDIKQKLTHKQSWKQMHSSMVSKRLHFFIVLLTGERAALRVMNSFVH